MTLQDPRFFSGKRVLITGHTGFKGGWLSWWLLLQGAEVYGLALEPEQQSLFNLSGLARHMHSRIGDVADTALMRDMVREIQPDVLFHCAAQALVLRSYEDPVETFRTNVMGTVSVLEASRHADSLAAVVVITTDKCYDNDNRSTGYAESDRLGGFDPYSASKACAEMVTSAYRQSFFAPGTAARVASVRAGNVIGGGDWSPDRLVADYARAAARGSSLVLRHPDAVRPWQHVLDPLAGYLMLAERLASLGGDAYASAWNFGPPEEEAASVRTLIGLLGDSWPGVDVVIEEPDRARHEAAMLRLDCEKARAMLGWEPMIRLPEATRLTAEWYREVLDDPASAAPVTKRQILEYEARPRIGPAGAALGTTT